VKRRAGWTVIALFTLAACGGRARRIVDTQGAAGGASSSEIPSASGSAGDPDIDAESGAADADVGAMPYASLIDSDTRGCENADYCFGLACYAPDSFTPNVCLAPCETDSNCQPFEVCLRAPKLEPTCYARCASPADCYRGFDCFDFSSQGELVCFPAGWTMGRDRLGY
jgi:hypothetical protein